MKTKRRRKTRSAASYRRAALKAWRTKRRMRQVTRSICNFGDKE